MLNPVDRHPLSYGQEIHRILLARQPGRVTAIHLQRTVNGPLNVTAFRGALDDCVRRHDALRLAISPDGDFQWTRPQPSDDDLVACESVKCRDARQFERYARARLAGDLGRPFDLSREYPFRFRLLRYSPELHAFLATFSHLAIDIRGRTIFARDLWVSYADRVRGGENRTVPGASFLSVARDERTAVGVRSSERFWASRAASLPPRLQIRSGCRPRHPTSDAHVEVIAIRAEQRTRLLKAAGRSGVTEFQWYCAAFVTALFDIAAPDVLKLTMPVDTRRVRDHDVVGMFVVPLPLRIRRVRGPGALLNEIRREITNVVAHRYIGAAALMHVERTASERWGMPWRTDAVVGTADGPDGGTPPLTGPTSLGVEVTQGAYQPAIAVVADGVGMTATLHAQRGADLHCILNGATVAPDASARFMLSMRERLEDLDRYDVGGIEPVADRSIEGNCELTALTDANGSIMAWVDLTAVADTLRTSPDVYTADVALEKAEDGGTAILATVVSSHATADALHTLCLDAAAQDDRLAVPNRFVVIPPARAPELTRQ